MYSIHNSLRSKLAKVGLLASRLRERVERDESAIVRTFFFFLVTDQVSVAVWVGLLGSLRFGCAGLVVDVTARVVSLEVENLRSQS